MADRASLAVLVKELDEVIQDANAMVAKKESVKDLIAFLEGIKTVLDDSEVAAAEDAAGALGGMRDSVRMAQGMISRHKRKRRLYRIVWLRALNWEVEQVVRGLESSLVQFQQSVSLAESSRVKLDELVARMKQTSYEVPNPDESDLQVLLTLDVNSLIVKLARDLGINFERDRELLARELRYFKADIAAEKQMEELETTIDEVLHTLACENSAVLQNDDDAIPSFDAFECPLTKQIMKDPVVLESDHTFERQAIEEWFRTCREQNREPTCPISGQVVSIDLHSNLVMRKTIEEWYQRKVASRLQTVVERLTAVEAMHDVEGALDEVLRLLHENPANKYRIKSVNLVPKIAHIWSLQGAAYFRSKALEVLDKIAESDPDSQHVIIREGFLRLSVRSLGSKEEDEKANAIRLLYRLSASREVCELLGKEKGAIIYLAGLVPSKNPDLSALAERTLRNLEEVESNILEMADAGRIQPLLTRLCEGPEEAKIKMAAYLANRHLVKSQVKLVAQSSTPTLLAMLGGTVQAKEASLALLVVLSSVGANKGLLVKAGVLAPLVDIMFGIQSSVNTRALKLKEKAAEVVSKLVSGREGDWEVASIDNEGNTLYSEFVVHNVLGLMTQTKPEWKHTLLEILADLASSPDVGDEVCEHIRSGKGVRVCSIFLSETSERSHRLNALKFLAVVSARLGTEIAKEFIEADMLGRIQALVRSSNNEERAAAALVLGSIPLTERQAAKHLDAEILNWTAATLAECKDSRRSHTRLMSDTVEGLLGILLHFLRFKDLAPAALRQHDLMRLLINQFDRRGEFAIKQKAAAGIKYLSERAPILSIEPEPSPLKFFCLRRPRPVKVCAIHAGVCNPSHPVCMVEAKALAPVLELLEEDDQTVQLAAVEALSTLFVDTVNLRGAVEELFKVDGHQKITELFYGLKQGELQDRTAWIVERIVRVEDFAKSFSVDTKLFGALVEAFKYGSPTTKALSQDALTNLKRISGVSGGPRRKK